MFPLPGLFACRTSASCDVSGFSGSGRLGVLPVLVLGGTAAVLLRLLEELDLPSRSFSSSSILLSRAGSQTLHSSRQPRTITPPVGRDDVPRRKGGSLPPSKLPPPTFSSRPCSTRSRSTCSSAASKVAAASGSARLRTRAASSLGPGLTASLAELDALRPSASRSRRSMRVARIGSGIADTPPRARKRLFATFVSAAGSRTRRSISSSVKRTVGSC